MNILSQVFHSKIQSAVNGRDVSAVALVSELCAADLAQAAILGVWLVSDTPSNDAPLQLVAGSDTSLLLTGIQTMIEREETFVSCDHGTQLPGVVTHPEAFDHSNSIILRPVSTSFDAYQALVNIVIRSNTIKLSLIESEDGSSTPELPTSNASKSETGLTGRRAALTAELIDLYPDHAAQLLGLDSKLAEYEKGNRFTVANIVREFLKENRLLALEGPALSRVKELWPQDALAKSPR